MNIAVDHYTDSDDDVCVIGSTKPPKPPTPPKSYSGGRLTIDVPGANADDDANTDSVDTHKYSFLSRFIIEACSICSLIKIC